MNSRAHGDGRRVEIAERRVSRCIRRLRRAATGLDRVLVERRDEDGRGLVEGAMRLTDHVGRAEPMSTHAAAP